MKAELKEALKSILSQKINKMAVKKECRLDENGKFINDKTKVLVSEVVYNMAPKGDFIKDAENWVEDNMPDQKIEYGEFESIHSSGQENYAIYSKWRFSNTRKQL